MKSKHVFAGLVVPVLALSACTAGSLGSSSGTGSGTNADAVTISFLIPTGEDNNAVAEAVIGAFEEANPDVHVQIETRPGGSEGDNLVKTRLATNDMADVFQYNSGSLLHALDPAQSLVDLSEEAWVADLEETFANTVSVGEGVYGSPWGNIIGGGVLYNKRVYDELGLDVPTTWAAFMENNAAIKAAGKTAVIGTYADSWTSQLFVLGDFHNVAMQDPEWATKYTENQAKFAQQPALRGFEHLQEVSEGDYMNSDFNAEAYEDGLALLASGDGVHYPMLTFAIPQLSLAHGDVLDDLGFFALPGDDAATNGATVWSPSGNYIPQSTTGEELEAAKRFVGFWATPDGCAAQLEASPVSGPWAVTTCELPADVPTMVADLQAYTEAGNASPALEFLSPVKGPALEQITVEVGSGIRPAADGAALYDEDVKKQAEQLGLPGW